MLVDFFCQGESISYVGLYLPKSHGQLYVAVSKLKSKSDLKILTFDPEGKCINITTNVVYMEVFSNIK